MQLCLGLQFLIRVRRNETPGGQDASESALVRLDLGKTRDGSDLWISTILGDGSGTDLIGSDPFRGGAPTLDPSYPLPVVACVF